MGKMLFRPPTLKFSSTLILPRTSKSYFNKVSLSHAEASGFPVHKKWISASMLSPTEVRYILWCSSVAPFKSTATTTFLDFNHFRVLSAAFAPVFQQPWSFVHQCNFLSRKINSSLSSKFYTSRTSSNNHNGMRRFYLLIFCREKELHKSSADSNNFLHCHKMNLSHKIVHNTLC